MEWLQQVIFNVLLVFRFIIKYSKTKTNHRGAIMTVKDLVMVLILPHVFTYIFQHHQILILSTANLKLNLHLDQNLFV